MYANYTVLATATAAQVLADIVAILTGTTNPNLLSASCDKPNTQILTTYNPAGWVVHDAAAGTNRQVLKAPCAHDASIYKYLIVDTNTAGALVVGTCQAWDAAAHTGTTVTLTGSNTRLFLTTAGIIRIAASARYAYIYPDYASGPGSGGTGAQGAMSGTLFLETKPNAWQLPGTSYIPMIMLDSAIGGTPHRAVVLKHRRCDDTEGASFTTGGGVWHDTLGSVSSPSYHYYYNGSAQRILLLCAIGERLLSDGAVAPVNTVFIGSMSEISNVYFTNPGGITHLDTCVDAQGNTRILLRRCVNGVVTTVFYAGYIAFLLG